MSEWPIRLNAPYALRKDGSWVWASARFNKSVLSETRGEWVLTSEWVVA